MPARAAGRSVPVVGASVRCRWTECRVHCGQGAIAARAERPTHSQTRQRPADLRFCRLARAHIVMREIRHAAQAEDLALHPGNGWRNVPQNARHQATALERSRSQGQADHRAGSAIVKIAPSFFAANHKSAGTADFGQIAENSHFPRYFQAAPSGKPRRISAPVSARENISAPSKIPLSVVAGSGS